MDKSKLALARAFDKVRQYEKTFEVCCTSFLDPAEQAEVTSAVKSVLYNLYGGYEGAERKILIIGTDEPGEVGDFLEVVSIECNEALTHRSVLGSVLGLGVKREMIGDIIINEKCADVIVLGSISNYIANNLKNSLLIVYLFGNLFQAANMDCEFSVILLHLNYSLSPHY